MILYSTRARVDLADKRLHFYILLENIFYPRARGSGAVFVSNWTHCQHSTRARVDLAFVRDENVTESHNLPRARVELACHHRPRPAACQHRAAGLHFAY